MSGLICNEDTRREDVRRETRLYGLDYLEVGEDPTELTVYFLGRAPDLEPADIRIEGGSRIRDIHVQAVTMTHSDLPEFDDFMTVQVDPEGDFSTHTLRVVDHDAEGRVVPPKDFDPRYSSIDFSFRIDCANEFDCAPQPVCPEPRVTPPEINYLAKDYASFRQVIYDRLALLMPDWQERHVPDIGVALVEVLAYTGDYLSYYQDAVATEAYLDTARQRISVRRHVRLVDYPMHEGCNARAWLTLEVTGDPKIDLSDPYFITNAGGALVMVGPVTTQDKLADATGQLPPGSYEIFESVVRETVQFHESHNEIHFYTWRQTECCLPAGTTSATLVAVPPGELHLSAGDMVIFEEVAGPVTGSKADADPSHRHAVRLTRVTPAVDPLDGTRIVEVQWGDEDALPFPLCLSALLPAPECRILGDISVARGNVILVDHGAPTDEDLPPVPSGDRQQDCGCNRLPGDVVLTAGKYRPRLSWRPLSFRQPYDGTAPASLVLQHDPREARPVLTLAAIPGGPDGTAALFDWADIKNPVPLLSRLVADPASSSNQVLISRLAAATRQLLHNYKSSDPPPAALLTALARDLTALLQWWSPAPDLLAASATDLLFVAEMDNDGYAHLRFGDGDMGESPEPGMTFHARYRIGNGPTGNVGAESIATLVTRTVALDGAVRSVRNPMAAAGGVAPQPLAEVKLLAPHEFRTTLERAIIADDYAAIALRDFAAKLQNAAATLRWTGSGYEVLVVVDPKCRETADPALLQAIAHDLERYRRIGHEVVVAPALRVPIELALKVCVKPHFRPDAVKRDLLDRFSNRVLANGDLGFFHPDNLTFGQGIYLSRVIALAQAAPGVRSVTVSVFRRYQLAATSGLDSGVLTLGPLEIAQADNDPNYPEHGAVEVIIL